MYGRQRINLCIRVPCQHIFSLKIHHHEKNLSLGFWKTPQVRWLSELILCASPTLSDNLEILGYGARATMNAFGLHDMFDVVDIFFTFLRNKLKVADNSLFSKTTFRRWTKS